MSDRHLRNFGLLFAVVFLLLAAWLRASAVAAWTLVALAGAMLACALAFPSLLARPARLWAKLGDLLHRVVSPVVLLALYSLLFVPFGLLRRRLGGDPLDRGYDPSAQSYWKACAARSRTLDDFRDQF